MHHCEGLIFQRLFLKIVYRVLERIFPHGQNACGIEDVSRSECSMRPFVIRVGTHATAIDQWYITDVNLIFIIR